MRYKTKELLSNPAIFCLKIVNLLNLSKLISDKIYIKLIHKKLTNKKINLNNPTTFCEKLQWLKLYYRKPVFTEMVDKYLAKKYVSNILGTDCIIPTLGVWNKFEDINFDILPKSFVLKSTNDSGGIIICKDKNELNLKKAKIILEKSLNNNYYYAGREWPYKNVVPRIIAEQFLSESNNSDLKDYKIFCFNGQPYFIQVDINRFTNHRRNFYSPQWELMNLSIIYENELEIQIERPNKLNIMLEYAKKLSAGLPFLRVDFYYVDEIIYFGEMTFYPEGGFGKINPEEENYRLGKLIKLPQL